MFSALILGQGCTQEVPMEPSSNEGQDNSTQDSIQASESQSSGQGSEQGPENEGPQRCYRDLDCEDPSAPACDLNTQRCVRCTHSQTHCTDPNAPFCTSVDGVASCEPCTMDEHCSASDDGPFCVRGAEKEGSEFRCSECRTHSDCKDPGLARCDKSPGMAQRCMPCNEVQGQCPEEQTCLLTQPGRGRCTERVIHVTQRGGCDNATGSKELPFCSFLDALEQVEPMVPTTIRMPSGDPSQLGVEVPDHVELSLVGRQGFYPQLRIGKGSQVSLHRLSVHSGIRVGNDSKLRLDAVEMLASSNLELISGAKAWVERSVFKSDASLIGTPLFDLNGATLKIASSVIAGHQIGSDDPNRDRLALFRLDSQSSLDLDHVTIADNNLRGAAPMLHCMDPQSQVSVQNSIVLDFQKSSQHQCIVSQLKSERVLSDMPALIGTTGARWEAQDWKIYFRDPAHQDYGLRDDAQGDATWTQIQTLGRWAPGQSARDLDGEPWRSGPGFVGADQG